MTADCPHGALAPSLCPACLRADAEAERDRRRLAMERARTDLAARDTAMARVEAATDDGWADRAWACLLARAAHGSPWTTDDLWDDLDGEQPREPRAMGPLIMRAVRARIIEDTGTMAPSRRRHHTKMTVWRGTP